MPTATKCQRELATEFFYELFIAIYQLSTPSWILNLNSTHKTFHLCHTSQVIYTAWLSITPFYGGNSPVPIL
jgi:hypothetical protein